MHQVVQGIKSGKIEVASVPQPQCASNDVLILNHISTISAGTEKLTTDLAKKSLLGKAMERPDQVRRVIEKLKSEGLISTIRQMRSKLDELIAPGYSSAGIVAAAGEGVKAFRPGDRVASNGPHAGIVAVPANLCAHVPSNVGFDQAAYGILGAIALNGVRLGKLGIGDTAFVVGLGLVGQITVALLKANGCRVLGTDLDPWKCETARKMGADEARTDMGATGVMDATRGLGADAVLICASTPSDGPVELAAEAVRQKGRVVAVGAVGLKLPRRPFYFKEAELVVSCSYGPGRYDPDYEERGHDYPAGHVRWTEQRNLQAVLGLMGSGRIDLSPLTTHRFPIEKALDAYAMIDEGKEKYLGILLEYPEVKDGALPRRIERKTAPPPAGKIGIGVLGAGNFAKTVLLPAIRSQGDFHPRVICAAGGVSAGHAGERHDFDAVTTDEAQVAADPAVKAVFVLTRHDLHAGQVLAALKAGKHVFCEKPLALTVEQLAELDAAIPQDRVLMVGFNRRFSPAAAQVRKFFADVPAPLTISVRMNAGAIPPEHWTQNDAEGGGRLIGEACHAIDLATFLAGSPPVRVYADSIGGPAAPRITDDQAFLTLRHANGSVSSIAYLAGGDRALGKERVEVLGGGRMAVIEDFQSVTTSAGGRIKRSKAWSQDKGHAAELEAFARAVSKGGPWPIPWEDLRAVSLASILAVRSLREGVPFDL